MIQFNIHSLNYSSNRTFSKHNIPVYRNMSTKHSFCPFHALFTFSVELLTVDE